MRAAAIWDLPPFFTHTNRTAGRSVVIVRGSSCGVIGWDGGVAGEQTAPHHDGDVDEGDEDGDLAQRADDAGEGLTRGDAEGPDGDRDGELEVVARGREGHRRGLRVVQPDRTSEQERA